MLVCDFCNTEIDPPQNGVTARMNVDNLDPQRQPKAEFDFHPECVRPWWQAAKAVTGTRPTTP
jgi:hypothetical protein